MSDGSKIEWTDSSWTPIRALNRETGGVGHFCVHVSDGCRNCYAERMQPRFGNPIRFAAQDLKKVELLLDEDALLQPLRWRKPRKVFVCSMTDLFGEWVPDEWIDRVFGVMALAHWHTFQVLTKRSARMRAYFEADRSGVLHHIHEVAADRRGDVAGYVAVENAEARGWPLPNVWLGVSAERQREADARIPDLLATPAAVRFVSAEPLLTPIELRPEWLSGLNWIIAGGESGPGWRDVPTEAFYSLRVQCRTTHLRFFMKQMPGKRPIPGDLLVRQFPTAGGQAA